MTMRKIEFVTPVKIGVMPFDTGDVKSFPTAEADEYVKVGWAKCCETGEQNDLVPGVQKLEVQSVIPTVKVS